MRYLLDTVVLIWAVRGLHEAPRVLRRLRERGDLAVASITILELRRALLPEEFRRAEEELEGVEVLPLDAGTARAAGDYLVRCFDEGYRTDFFAGIIQATAARAGRALVTYGPHQYPLAECESVPRRARAVAPAAAGAAGVGRAAPGTVGRATGGAGPSPR